jgi:hypothetical protein
VASSFAVLSETGEPQGPPWPVARVALSQATRHHLLIGWHLRVLGDERDPICPLTTVEASPRKRATRKQLDKCSVMVMAVPGEAPAPTTVPMVVVTTYGPPPSSSLTREALTHRGDGGAAIVARVWVATTSGRACIYRGKGPA